MEFQTSFIPKNPITEEKLKVHEPINPFRFFIVILFFIVFVGSGGIYLYKVFLAKKLVSIDAELRRIETGFDQGLVNDMQKLASRLGASKEVLSNHIVVSPLFNILEQNTLKTVRFNKFQYDFSREKSEIDIKMTGQASSYTSLALQAGILGSQKGIISPVFSNLDVDNKGRVTFDLDFSIDPKFLLYEENLVSLQ